MKVLVIGGGGREHALVWKLKQSPRVSQLYCVPGNGGISDEAECLPGDVKSVDSMLEIANRLRPDLTVVGPEVPLMAGIVDEFQKREYPVFGPTKAAAQIEGSKSFAKLFMQRHRIPTGHYAVVTNKAELQKALSHLSAPVVVKADGLAAGKGVVIAKTKEEASTVADEMLSGKMLGEAGMRVVLEEFLKGEELSFLVMSDGERGVPLVAAQDHKRVGDNDTGPNTGGMGAYSTDKVADPQMREWLLKNVARPVIQGMKQDGMEFKGILYCGIMMTAKGPMVLEFNARFGDPETQAILMRLDSDLVDAFEASVKGRISEGDFKWSPDPAVTVVMASGGYPGAYEVGKKIYGLDDASKVEGVKIFHAGTTKREGEYYTAGGRVLNVTARAKTLPDAVNLAYDAIMKIRFDGMIYRKDIAARGLKALK
jgi:phosphoribosylamine---glycine ligase